MNKIRILIAEDIEIDVQGLQGFIALEADMKTVDIAFNGLTLLEMLTRYSGEVDVLLVSSDMSKLDALKTIVRIREMDKHVKILVMTSHHSQDFMPDALRVGANGVIAKNRSQKEFVDAIRRVYRGGASILQWWEHIQASCYDLINRCNSKAKIEFSTGTLDESVMEDVRKEARYILQTLVFSALNSVNVTEISVQIDREGNMLTILVSDNGVIYDTTVEICSTRLNDIQEYVEQKLEGLFSIDSLINEGTIVFTEIPLYSLIQKP